MPQDYFVCPYNNAHVMKMLTAHSHVVKCRLANPQMNLKICPFNALHHVPTSDLASHVEDCPDRTFIVETEFQSKENAGGNCRVPPVRNIVTSPQGEYWDSD